MIYEQLELFSTGSTVQMLLDKQREFGKQYTDFGNMTEYAMQLRLLDFISCAIEELVEMRREIPCRKYWSKDKDDEPSWKNIKEELIDVLHFVLSMFLVLEMDEDEICGLYLLKNNLNIQRAKESL